jgi:hypothetical protein
MNHVDKPYFIKETCAGYYIAFRHQNGNVERISSYYPDRDTIVPIMREHFDHVWDEDGD